MFKQYNMYKNNVTPLLTSCKPKNLKNIVVNPYIIKYVIKYPTKAPII